MRHIVILGCGFGGLEAARTVESAIAGRRHVDLTVVNSTAHFLYTPLLGEVAAGRLPSTAISAPARQLLADTTDLVVDHIETVDLEARQLVGRCQTVDFDYLILAPGARTDWRSARRPRQWAMPLADAADAVDIADTMADAFESAHALSDEALRRRLTFTIVGAGPTGVELAGQLASAAERRFFPEVDPPTREAFRVVLAEKRDTILPGLPPELQLAARHELQRLGVELRIDCRVVDGRDDRVECSEGPSIAADHVIWCGGHRGPGLQCEPDVATDEHGRLHVDSTLRLSSHPRVFALGDAAVVEGTSPGKAGAATEQGRTAAQNLVNGLSGQAPRHWTDEDREAWLLALGSKTLGYRQGALIEGWPARTFYKMFHTSMMPGTMQKATLVAQWLRGTLEGVAGEPTTKSLPEDSVSRALDESVQ